jgi:hypothetical protein
MLVNTTTEVVRIMGVWVRRADAGLARSAALNAAHSMDTVRSRQLDDARTLRDLSKIPTTDSPAATASRRATN